MPAEDTQITCFAFDRKENVRGIRTLRFRQTVRFKRTFALDIKMPFLLAFLRLSTDASMHSFQLPKPSRCSFAHR